MNQEEKGILVDQVVQAVSRKKNSGIYRILYMVIQFVYLLLGAFGFARCLIEPFEISNDPVILAVGIAVLCLLYCVIFHFRKLIKFALPIILAVLVAFCVLYRDILGSGLQCIYNQIAGRVNEYYDIALPLAASGTLSASTQMVSILAILTVFIGILAAGIIFYTDARITALVFVIPLSLTLATGFLPDLSSAIMMLAAEIGTFFLQYTKPHEALGSGTVTVVMGANLGSKVHLQVAAAAGIILLLLVPLSFYQVGARINAAYEENTDFRDTVKSGDALNGMHEFWKQLTRGELDWLPFDIVRSSGVHGGKLSNVKETQDHDELHLYLDISADLNVPLYIRGYVGSNYTGKGWKQQTSAQKEAAAELGISVGDLCGRYYNLLKTMQSEGNEAVYGNLRFVITNMDANTLYSYIPYGSDISAFDGSKAYDTYPAEKTDETAFNLYYLNTQNLNNLNALEQAGLAGGDDAYFAYAAENYLTLPEKGLDSFYEEFGGKTFSSIAECVSFVRDTLAEHAEYTTAPGSTPGGKDYVEYFLYENKKGCCTQFASAAVLLFRLFGIPARYVEGYLTTNLTSGNGANRIMDSSAHAWAEIYVKGVGWIPIETTPGFVNEKNMTDDKESDSDDSGDIPDINESQEETTQAEESTEDLQLEITTQAPETHVQETTQPTQATQATQPTQPTQSSAQNQTSDSQDNSQPAWIKTLLSVLAVIIGVILILAAVIGFFLLRYRKRRAALEKRLSGNPRTAVLAALELVEKISDIQGLVLDEYVDLDQAAEKYPFFDRNTIRRMKALALEAGFSNHELDEAAKEEAISVYRTLIGKVQNGSTGLQKWYQKYILCWI